MKIIPYKMYSGSAKALAEALNIKRVRKEGKPLRIRGMLINWGNSDIKRQINADKIINSCEAVNRASNKLETFRHLIGDVDIPEYTTSKEVAESWLIKNDTCVVARSKLRGHSGEGITLHGKGSVLPDVPLYTKYIPKMKEYRLHVMNGNVFFAQEKKRRFDVPDEEVNWQVRNHANGFNYANQDVQLPPNAEQNAIAAIAALDLDFGAVDMIYNAKQNKYFVLEINTAPGLFGTTLEKYVEQFQQYE